VENAAAMAEASAVISASLLKAAKEVAANRHLSGYRTVFNTGEAVGQSVFHAHMHLLGGRDFTWPPG
jgi:histidine triad (HIT) family protein